MCKQFQLTVLCRMSINCEMERNKKIRLKLQIKHENEINENLKKKK